MEQSLDDTNNPQERLLGSVAIASFIEGDGNITLTESKNRIWARVQLYNCDDGLIEKYSEILHMLGVGHYIQQRRHNSKLHSDSFVVTITGHRRVKKLLDATLPFYAGRKSEVANLVNEFITRRLSMPGNAPFSATDRECVKRVRSLNAKGPRVSSETIRQTGSPEDIVQAA